MSNDSHHAAGVVPSGKVVERPQLYVTLSTSIFGVLGVFLGAFLPLIYWLDAQKTTYWIVATATMFIVLGVVLPRIFSLKSSTRFLVSFIPFAVFWTFLPILSCSVIFFFGDASKDCYCNDYEGVDFHLQKFNDKVGITDRKQLNLLLERTKRGVVAFPVFHHPPDVKRLLTKLRADPTNHALINFANSWQNYQDETAIALMRMLAAFSSTPLAPSDYSTAYQERLKYQLSRRPNEIVVISDTSAILSFLKALAERAVDYKPLADKLLVESADKLLSLRFMKLYSRIARLKQENRANMDDGFWTFVSTIPGHDEIVKRVGYPGVAGQFVKFEAGNPPIYAISSYSRFLVPRSVVEKSVLERRLKGPWPMGKPQKYFSENWWLKHATWQMFGREQGRYLDNLALRIYDFDVVGAP
ncbi:MAG: hypothetical protein OXU75_01540 [Deltaproteobacteria bacterium]|nr:hypothetical protein [Deltaproteobacteria bacterium]